MPDGRARRCAPAARHAGQRSSPPPSAAAARQGRRLAPMGEEPPKALLLLGASAEVEWPTSPPLAARPCPCRRAPWPAASRPPPPSWPRASRRAPPSVAEVACGRAQRRPAPRPRRVRRVGLRLVGRGDVARDVAQEVGDLLHRGRCAIGSDGVGCRRELRRAVALQLGHAAAWSSRDLFEADRPIPGIAALCRDNCVAAGRGGAALASPNKKPADGHDGVQPVADNTARAYRRWPNECGLRGHCRHAGEPRQRPLIGSPRCATASTHAEDVADDGSARQQPSAH